MGQKKLFTVKLSVEIVVVAEDESAARSVAISSLSPLRDVNADEYDVHASPMQHLPEDWEPSAIPFGNDHKAERDLTIQNWIDLGSAPEYKAKS